jgi:hypothetical protein
MQTYKLTLMLEANYNYVQFNELNCGEAGANCDDSCLDGKKPNFIANGLCFFC